MYSYTKVIILSIIFLCKCELEVLSAETLFFVFPCFLFRTYLGDSFWPVCIVNMSGQRDRYHKLVTSWKVSEAIWWNEHRRNTNIFNINPYSMFNVLDDTLHFTE